MLLISMAAFSGGYLRKAGNTLPSSQEKTPFFLSVELFLLLEDIPFHE
jgi:hypothetical protein